MTIENPHPLDLFPDPWPLEVTEDNRTQIRENLLLKLSPAASAALIIQDNDVTAMFADFMLWHKISPKDAFIRMSHFRIGTYSYPATILLESEIYKETGSVGDPEFDKVYIELLKKIVPEKLNAVENSILIENVETQLLYERLNRIRQQEGALKAYDAIVTDEKQKADDPDTLMALEKSRQRFYQLYSIAEELAQELETSN